MRRIRVIVAAKQSTTVKVGQIVRGFYQHAMTRNWETIRSEAPFVAASIDELQPDYVIAVGTGDMVPTKLIDQRRVIVVDADYSARSVPSVLLDDEQAGRMAAEHLLSRGFRSLAAFGYWISSEKVDLGWAIARANGMESAAHDAHARFERFGETHPGAHVDASYDRIDKWLQMLPRPVGILACCDPWTQPLLLFARRAKLRVPEDVAIMGVDDNALFCDTATPPISSVIAPWERIGREAGALLDLVLRGQTITQAVRVAPAGVTIRRSTDTDAVADEDVAAALRLIHLSAKTTLSVADILRKVPVHQRQLERKFRAIVGRRMSEEIRRTHVERAKLLLATTPMSMPQIAAECGLADARRLSTLFRQEIGMTPSAYRRQHHT